MKTTQTANRNPKRQQGIAVYHARVRRQASRYESLTWHRVNNN
ncbi:MAG: hypothetical protein AAFN70_10700 [Planctomycetota bacterium]